MSTERASQQSTQFGNVQQQQQRACVNSAPAALDLSKSWLCAVHLQSAKRVGMEGSNVHEIISMSFSIYPCREKNTERVPNEENKLYPRGAAAIQPPCFVEGGSTIDIMCVCVRVCLCKDPSSSNNNINVTMKYVATEQKLYKYIDLQLQNAFKEKQAKTPEQLRNSKAP